MRNRLSSMIKVGNAALLRIVCVIVFAWTVDAESSGRSFGRSISCVKGREDAEFSKTIQTVSGFIEDLLFSNFGGDPDAYPGVSIAMVHDGKVVWATGFGHADIEKKIPAGPDTVYILASVSKHLAAAACMQLYDQGVLDLDAPVVTYIPEFGMKGAGSDVLGAITARRLLNHHSGIPGDAESSGLFTDHHWSGYSSFLLGYIGGDYPAQFPGEIAVYSNVAFDLAAILASRITRRNFADLCRDRIFDPLGMNASAFGRVYENMAIGYDDSYGVIRPYSQGYGSDGAASSVNDMAQYLLMLLGGGRHPDGVRILNAETVTTVMATPEIGILDAYQTIFRPGLGWDNVDQPELQYAGPALLKGGNDIGYNSMIGVMPGWDLGVVVICNHDRIATLPSQTVIRCLQAAVEDLGGPAPSDPILPEMDTETEFNRIVGYYSGAARATIDRISVHDETTLLWERNILSPEPETVLLERDKDQNAFFEASGKIPEMKIRFKGVETASGETFVLIMEMRRRTAITMQKFNPVLIHEAWKQRNGLRYMMTSFRHDGVCFSINPYEVTFHAIDDVEFLTVSGIPVLPVTRELAFVAGPVVNRGDTCVRIVGQGAKEKLLFFGSTFCRVDGIPEIPVGSAKSFPIRENELSWHRVILPNAGEYHVDFPGDARIVVYDDDLAIAVADSNVPFVWNCSDPGTYYFGLVTARPANAFLKISETYPPALVTVNSSEGGDASVVPERTVAGKSATLTATPDAGNVFLRWDIEAGVANIKERFHPSTSIIPQSDVIVKAIFAPESESVTVHLTNVGIGKCDPTEKVHALKNEPFTLKAVPDDGFSFVEWKMVGNGAVQIDNPYSAVATMIPAESVVLEAVFRGNPIVAKDRAKMTVTATGGNPLLADVTLQNAPLSADVFGDGEVPAVQGVSCGGTYFALNGEIAGSGVRIDPKKGTWHFRRKSIPVRSVDWNAGQIDFVLHTEAGTSCWNPHWNTRVQTTFSFDSGKQAQVPAMITGKPMTDFKIGRMTLRTVSGKGGRDKLLVRNATFILPGLTFPENGVVTLTVGELTMRMPSVEQEPQNWKKRNGVYTYTNRAFYRGTVKATFDMNRNEWRLQLDRAALGGASFADHPVVRLSIGEFEAGSALETRSKMSLKSPF